MRAQLGLISLVGALSLAADSVVAGQEAAVGTPVESVNLQQMPAVPF